MEIPLEKPVGIVVTSYEGNRNPVLSHIFWGETVDEAVGMAKSHLVTDFFFSSSFNGSMRWKDSRLQLDVKIYGVGDIFSDEEDKAVDDLEFAAEDIHNQQIQEGYDRLIQRIAKKQ